jgi:hypothetical protein
MRTKDPWWNDRMKSARRKKRLQKEDLEKKLIALYKERKQLWLQIKNLGYKPLVPPIQKGWKRFFVVRDDVQRTSKSDFFEQLLNEINTVQYSDMKQFKVRKRKRGKKFYVDREQKLKSFNCYEWQRLKFTDEQKLYFTETLVMNQQREFFKVYEFNEPWRYVLKIAPNMITLLQIKDSLLEQRLGEISNYLERNNLTGKLNRLVYGKSKYTWYHKKNLKNEDPLLNKPIHKVLEAYYN